jgi:hypothetical protein
MNNHLFLWRQGRTAETRPGHPALPLSPVLLVHRRLGENWWANDIDGSALAAQPGKLQGRPQRKPGLEAHHAKRPANLRSPEGPCPSRPNLSRQPDDTGALNEQFHAARNSSGRGDGCRSCLCLRPASPSAASICGTVPGSRFEWLRGCHRRARPVSCTGCDHRRAETLACAVTSTCASAIRAVEGGASRTGARKTSPGR